MVTTNHLECNIHTGEVEGEDEIDLEWEEVLVTQIEIQVDERIPPHVIGEKEWLKLVSSYS